MVSMVHPQLIPQLEWVVEEQADIASLFPAACHQPESMNATPMDFLQHPFSNLTPELSVQPGASLIQRFLEESDLSSCNIE